MIGYWEDNEGYDDISGSDDEVLQHTKKKLVAALDKQA